MYVALKLHMFSHVTMEACCAVAILGVCLFFLNGFLWRHVEINTIHTSYKSLEFTILLTLKISEAVSRATLIVHLCIQNRHGKNQMFTWTMENRKHKGLPIYIIMILTGIFKSDQLNWLKPIVNIGLPHNYGQVHV